MAHIEEMLVNGILTPVVKFDHSAQEIDDAVEKIPESGAAPAGFGLGELNGKTINALDEIDGFGFYRIPTESGIAPDTNSNWGAVFVGANIHYGTLIASRAGGLIATLTKGGVWADRWEWVNPPMEIGVEYRTTERYMGKPVYAKCVYLGLLPNNTSATYPIAENIHRLTHCVIEVQGGVVNVLDSYYSRITASANGVLITSVNDASALGEANAFVKYTKTTD